MYQKYSTHVFIHSVGNVLQPTQICSKNQLTDGQQCHETLDFAPLIKLECALLYPQ